MSAQEKYEEFLTHLPVTASDRVLMALKGHLLVEQALREFVSKRVAKPQRLKDKQIPFAIILDFASSLDDGDSMGWVWDAAKKLNRLRNLLAHNLSPLKIEELEIEFIDYIRKHDGELSVLVDNTPVRYEELALAIFQIYDRIVSKSNHHPPDPHHFSTRNEIIKDDLIRTAITKAFLAIDGNSSPSSNTGPKPRKRWPQR